MRLHAVIGGDGPPLLLIHGWPGSWYYWRLVMPALARAFQVIAVDQRGIGLSDKPEQGYDTAIAVAKVALAWHRVRERRWFPGAGPGRRFSPRTPGMGASVDPPLALACSIQADL